ncbi:MAG: hypothetical protein GC154_06025 [bacterium]|nr:hypothetical protein [bacterium]
MADLYDKLKRFQRNTTGAGETQSPSLAPAARPLPESLQNIPGLMRGRDLIGAVERREENKSAALDSIGVVESRNEHGVFGLREIEYPLADLPYTFTDVTGPEMTRLAREERLASLSGGDLLYIDTETTGLAGGAGTVAFLIGVGWFDREAFHVRQYLLRDYDEEPAALAAFENDLSRFAAVASYNGKGFDLPLLQNRCLLNRRRINLIDIPHFDLLYPARRFWRGCFENCRLSCIEANVLGRTRDEDIPGELIPYVYFDFLRGIRVDRMSPVVAHNAEDILSLALLSAKTCRMLRDPERECERAAEWVGLSRVYAALGDWESASHYLNEALERPDLPAEAAVRAHWTLGVMFKRQERFDEALAVWERLASEYSHAGACVEAAKLNEHRRRDYGAALRWAEKALELTVESSPLFEDAVMTRLRRLESKIKGNKTRKR